MKVVIFSGETMSTWYTCFPFWIIHNITCTYNRVNIHEVWAVLQRGAVTCCLYYSSLSFTSVLSASTTTTIHYKSSNVFVKFVYKIRKAVRIIRNYKRYGHGGSSVLPTSFLFIFQFCGSMPPKVRYPESEVT